MGCSFYPSKSKSLKNFWIKRYLETKVRNHRLIHSPIILVTSTSAFQIPQGSKKNNHCCYINQHNNHCNSWSLWKFFIIIVAFKLSKNESTSLVNAFRLIERCFIADKWIDIMKNACLLVHAFIVELDSKPHWVEEISTCFAKHTWKAWGWIGICWGIQANCV